MASGSANCRSSPKSNGGHDDNGRTTPRPRRIRPPETTLPNEARYSRTVLLDGDKFSTQVGRLDVVERGRHRRWSEDENIKIVLESLQAPRQITATARRYGISRSLLLRWRQLFRAERNATEQLIALTRASQKVHGSGSSPHFR
ncbi:transposase [Bradyrhizobium sp. BR 1432]|uniref:transposase n=1 Tax=Bradyrhizobium sp. BR 1432 TaxID=3447966 RepID=UPI003EE644D3